MRARTSRLCPISSAISLRSVGSVWCDQSGDGVDHGESSFGAVGRAGRAELWVQRCPGAGDRLDEDEDCGGVPSVRQFAFALSLAQVREPGLVCRDHSAEAGTVRTLEAVPRCQSDDCWVVFEDVE